MRSCTITLYLSQGIFPTLITPSSTFPPNENNPPAYPLNSTFTLPVKRNSLPLLSPPTPSPHRSSHSVTHINGAFTVKKNEGGGVGGLTLSTLPSPDVFHNLHIFHISLYHSPGRPWYYVTQRKVKMRPTLCVMLTIPCLHLDG